MIQFKNGDKKTRLVYVLITVVYLVFFYGYFYSDILITTSHGINFWDVIFSGGLFDFHALCCSDVENAAYTITTIYAGYDFPIYVLFGIWNFPLWVIRKLTGANIWESVLALMWAKSIILVFIALTVRALWKLCDTMEMSGQKLLVALLFLTSPIIAGSAAVNSQYDVITAYFMLEALNCFLNGKKKGFAGNILLATLIKPFALSIFVPLILYAEKNVIKIGLYTLCVLAPYLGFKIIIPNNTQLTTFGTVLTLFKNKVNISSVEIPVFFLVSFLFWIICYMYRMPDDKKEFYRKSVLISYLSLAIFFLLCASNPYWVIMLLPFQCLLIGAYKKYAFLGVILETAGSICLIGHYVIELPWCFDVKILRSSFFAKLFGLRVDTTDNVLDLVHNISEGLYDMRDRGSGFLFGLFFTASLAFIWLNLTQHNNVALEEREVPRYMMWIRLLLSLGVCLIPMTAYIL